MLSHSPRPSWRILLSGVLTLLAAGAGQVHADTIQPYKAQEIQPVQAEPVKPYTAEEVKPYKAEEVKPVQADTIEEYHAKTIEVYHAETIEPYVAETILPYVAGTVSPVYADEVPAVQAGTVEPYTAQTVKPLTKAEMDRWNRQFNAYVKRTLKRRGPTGKGRAGRSTAALQMNAIQIAGAQTQFLTQVYQSWGPGMELRSGY